MKSIRTEEGKHIYKAENFKDYVKTFGRVSLVGLLTPLIILKQALDVLEGENFIDSQIENCFNIAQIFEFIFTGKYTDTSVKSGNAIKKRKLKKAGASKEIANFIVNDSRLRYKFYTDKKKKRVEIDFNHINSWDEQSHIVFDQTGKDSYKMKAIELATGKYKALRINSEYIFNSEMVVTMLEEISKKEKF